MKCTRTGAMHVAALALAALTWVAGSLPSRAHEGGKGHAKAHSATDQGAAGVWHSVQEQTRELDQVIKKKKLAQVHEIAFEIRDLVRTLPDKSTSLAGDQQKKLGGYVKQVDQLAKELDEAGDSKNQKTTEAHNKHLHQVLHNIEHLYPAGTLSASQAGKK